MARVTSSVTPFGVLIAIAWGRQRRYLTSSLATQRVLGRLSLSLKRLNLYRLFPIVKHVISLRKHPYRVLSFFFFDFVCACFPCILFCGKRHFAQPFLFQNSFFCLLYLPQMSYICTRHSTFYASE